MDKLIKLIILAGVIYGIFWVYQNVDFNQLVNDKSQAKILVRLNGDQK